MSHIKLESFTVQNGQWKATLSTTRFFKKKNILAAGVMQSWGPSQRNENVGVVADFNVSKEAVKDAVWKGWRVFYNGEQ